MWMKKVKADRVPPVTWDQFSGMPPKDYADPAQVDPAKAMEEPSPEEASKEKEQKVTADRNYILTAFPKEVIMEKILPVLKEGKLPEELKGANVSEAAQDESSQAIALAGFFEDFLAAL